MGRSVPATRARARAASTSSSTRPAWKYSSPRWRSPGWKCEAVRLNSGTGWPSAPGGRPRPCPRRRRLLAGGRSLIVESREGVEDLLDVLVLLQPVDQPQHLGGLVLGQAHRGQRNVLRLGRDGSDAAVLEGLLELAELGERAAQQQLRLAL